MAVARECRHFIPLSTGDLLELLGSDAPPAEAEHLRTLADHLHHAVRRANAGRAAAMKRSYAPFDPDSDTPLLKPLPEAERLRRLNGCLAETKWFLERARFRHLGGAEIEPMLRDASRWGMRMRVDFGVFEHLALFVRGEGHDVRKLRDWTTLFREEEIEAPIFRRLVLVMKFRPGRAPGAGASSEHVYVRMFKDVPRDDVDMLLPGARVRLFLLDRGKIGFGLLSGLATMCWRMGEDLLRLLHSLVFTDTLLWGLTAGTLGYGFKSYSDYRQTQQAYHLTLAQHLYFQSLDGNAGVLSRLVEEAAEQEERTALLAWSALRRVAGAGGATAADLETTMELMLDPHAALACTPGEPLACLARLGLVRSVGDRHFAREPGDS